MESIIEAGQKDLDELLDMSMDLWTDEDREEFRKHFTGIFDTDNNKVFYM